MLRSIGKYSKSLLLKIFVGIIILPFIFWGMGDVFRGGNQNIVATIDSTKISTQEFINFFNRLNLSDEEKKNINNSDLVEKILSEFIGRKIIELEIENLGIKLTDSSLRDIIKNDKLFHKENKFKLEMEKLREELNGILAKTSGQPLEKIQQDTDRDFYLNAEEAIEYGLADEIVTGV